MFEIGRTLLFIGILFILVGGIMMAIGKVPGIGKMPGDILIQRKNFTFYFPITTSIVVSIFLSLVFWLLSKR